MFELRMVIDEDGNAQLQQRTRSPVWDASGAVCDFGAWSDWKSIPVVKGEHLPDRNEVRYVVETGEPS